MQYERLQTKYDRAWRNAVRARSRRRKRYWSRQCNRILATPPTVQELAERAALQQAFESIL